MIPKSLQIISLGCIISAGVIFSSYFAGKVKERGVWQLKVEKMVVAEVTAELAGVNERLNKLILSKQKKDSVIKEQEATLKHSSDKIKILQEKLNNAIKDEDTNCSPLPDSYIELLKGMYNQEPVR